MCSWIVSVLFFLMSLFMFHPAISAPLIAHPIKHFEVDMFGDDSPSGQAILKKYRPALIQYVQRGIHGKSVSKAVFKQIKAEGHYLYVKPEMVVYPGISTSYITLNVIKAQARDRLRWVSPRKGKPAPVRHDTVGLMQNYSNKGMTLLMQNKLKPSDMIECHPYHCLFGFKDPQLKPYRKQFEDGIHREKASILSALNDSDPGRRKAAAFLVGEFSNPQEIMQQLIPHVADQDDGVRNAVMRVIGDTMRHAKRYEINVHPFIQLLNSPYETDRNKALVVLTMAMKWPENKKIIKKEAWESLQHFVKLKQPNNHDFAVSLLKQLG